MSIRMTGNLDVITPTFSTNPNTSNLSENNTAIQREMATHLQRLKEETQALNVKERKLLIQSLKYVGNKSYFHENYATQLMWDFRFFLPGRKENTV